MFDTAISRSEADDDTICTNVDARRHSAASSTARLLDQSSTTTDNDTRDNAAAELKTQRITPTTLTRGDTAALRAAVGRAAQVVAA